MANPIVIDLSHHNSKPDFKKIKDGGTVGVILKATEGTGYIDPTFKQYGAEADAAGLCVSSYHFLKKGNVEAQMEFYLSVVAPAAGDRLVIDYEDKGLTLADLETAVQHLWKIAPQCEVTVYGASGFLGSHLGGKKSETLAKTALWVASYTTASKPTMTGLTGTWPYWSLWQYTDKATLSGISGPVDGNKWNGTETSLPGWFHKGGAAPAPTPPEVPNDKPVTVAINVPLGVTCVVTVNGKLLA